jgi:hypothetical protein
LGALTVGPIMREASGGLGLLAGLCMARQARRGFGLARPG